jgi:hypothetical protein
MKITLSKDEVEKIILDYVNSFIGEYAVRFNRAHIDCYGYANFATVENVKEETTNGTGT